MSCGSYRRLQFGFFGSPQYSGIVIGIR